MFGGALTTSGQLLIERGRAKREREAEERRQARELRLAVRLVIEELAESLGLIEGAAKSRRYWRAPRLLPTNTWNEYRTDIAAAIDSALEWRHITAAYDAINNLNWTVQHRRSTSSDTNGHQLGFWIDAADGTRDAWRAIRLAMDALEKTLAITGPASRVVGNSKSAERHLWPHGDGGDFDLEGAMLAEEEEFREQEYRRDGP